MKDWLALLVCVTVGALLSLTVGLAEWLGEGLGEDVGRVGVPVRCHVPVPESLGEPVPENDTVGEHDRVGNEGEYELEGDPVGVTVTRGLSVSEQVRVPLRERVGTQLRWMVPEKLTLCVRLPRVRDDVCVGVKLTVRDRLQDAVRVPDHVPVTDWDADAEVTLYVGVGVDEQVEGVGEAVRVQLRVRGVPVRLSEAGGDPERVAVAVSVTGTIVGVAV